MTDRYALSNGSTTSLCDTAVEEYCGGTWQGIIDNLDYIQNMGFTAVRLVRPSIRRIIDEIAGMDKSYCQQHIIWVPWILGSRVNILVLAEARDHFTDYLQYIHCQ